MSPATDITRTGTIMGTPRYMAPEAIRGETIDARSDLFAAGAILFEMLAGRPAFDGRTIADVIHATVYEQPPALSGSSTVAAVDRVIRQALAKRPSDRLPSAEVMAEELRWAGGLDTEASTSQAHALTRLVVLAVPHSEARPGDRLSGVQSSRRDHHVALRHRIVDRALERGGIALCRRHAGSQGARDRRQRRSRRHGHAAAIGRSAPRGGAARRSARRHGADVAHRAGAARRSVPPAGRYRPPRRGGVVAAADRRRAAHTRHAAQRPRL